MRSLKMIFKPLIASCSISAALALALALAASAQAAATARAPSRPARVHVGFAQIATGAQASVEGNEIFIEAFEGSNLTSPLVAINDATGQRQVITEPSGCHIQLFAPSAVLYGCGAPVTQYSAQGLAGGPLTPLTVSGYPLGLGTAWVSVESKGPDEHSPVVYSFDSVATGAVRPDPLRPGGSVRVSLNNPGLTVPLCKPLRFPRAWDPNAGGWIPGGFTQLGRFALATGTYPDTAPHYAFPLYQFEECGHRQKVTIDARGSEIGASPQLVVWQSSRAWLSGLVLPSERRFSIHVPVTMRHFGLTPEVGAKHLYINDQFGTIKIWRTSLEPILTQVAPRQRS